MTETVETTPEAERIAAQNDEFRRNIICGGGEPQGRVLTTRAVAEMGALFMVAATWAVATDATFTEDNDPNGDHSFGAVAVAVEGRKVWWKIDLYDLAYRWGSETPDDPARTRRVLTIMFPEDY